MSLVPHCRRIPLAFALLASGLIAACPVPRAADLAEATRTASEVEPDCSPEPDLWIASTRRLSGICQGPAAADLAV